MFLPRTPPAPSSFTYVRFFFVSRSQFHRRLLHNGAGEPENMGGGSDKSHLDLDSRAPVVGHDEGKYLLDLVATPEAATKGPPL